MVGREWDRYWPNRADCGSPNVTNITWRKFENRSKTLVISKPCACSPILTAWILNIHMVSLVSRWVSVGAVSEGYLLDPECCRLVHWYMNLHFKMTRCTTRVILMIIWWWKKLLKRNIQILWLLSKNLPILVVVTKTIPVFFYWCLP